MDKIPRTWHAAIGIVFFSALALAQSGEEARPNSSTLIMPPDPPTLVSDAVLEPLPRAAHVDTPTDSPNTLPTAVNHSSDVSRLTSCAHPHGARCRCSCSYLGRARAYLARKHAYYWGNLPEFEERPLGAAVFAQMNTQVINGLAAQMALYMYDFHDVESEFPESLTARGRIQLEKIARILTFNDCPIMIEGTGKDGLDAARRNFVFEAIGRLNTPISEDQIVTSVSLNRGLNGTEALEMYENLLQQTRNLGGQLGGGSGDSGFNGGSLNGGGILPGR